MVAHGTVGARFNAYRDACPLPLSPSLAYRNTTVKPELQELLERALGYAAKIQQHTRSDEGHVFVLTMIADYNRCVDVRPLQAMLD